VPRAKRNASGEDRRTADWLGPITTGRVRPWALEEELFGFSARQLILEELESDLADERLELARMEQDLRTKALKVARSEERLETLKESIGRRQPRRRLPQQATAWAAPVPADRALALRQCEGFEVDSPDGRIGVVEGFRYHSGIEEPDELEVRAGWLGRRLLVIPVHEIEEIVVDEGRLVIRGVPAPRRDLWQGLLGHLGVR
jgi:hypothetical protein